MVREKGVNAPVRAALQGERRVNISYLCFPRSTLVARLRCSYARMFGCSVKDAGGGIERTAEYASGKIRFEWYNVGQGNRRVTCE